MAMIRIQILETRKNPDPEKNYPVPHTLYTAALYSLAFIIFNLWIRIKIPNPEPEKQEK